MEAIRSVNGHDEIWFGKKTWQGGYWGDELFVDEYLREILIYRPDEGKWDRSTILAGIENTDVYVDSLYITSDGSVWGGNRWNTRIKEHPFDEVPVLSKYNDITRLFEYAPGILTVPIVENVLAYYDWPVILLDREDVFWIFVKDEAIFSYDTETNETKKHALIANIDVREAVLSTDGSIYFRNPLIHPEIQEEDFFRFYPESGEIIPLKLPPESWPSGPISVDNAGNLWFGAIGHRSPEGSWHLLHPNPEGYIENLWKDPRWVTPHILLETTNGMLWFRKWSDGAGDEGMAWYDPRTMEGCWFTNEVVFDSLLEDSQQNLWMLLDGNLYKYALEP
jgi:hypothetical protein